MTGKVIFEASEWGNRYRVESQVLGGYRWEFERGFDEKSSAIYHAEMILMQRGMGGARVVDTLDSEGVE